MKVFLLYPDKDFNRKVELPANLNDLIKDLELEIILQSMTNNDSYLLAITKLVFFTNVKSTEIIRYRQDILKDILKEPLIFRKIYQISFQSFLRKRHYGLGIYSNNPTGILNDAVQLLSLFHSLLTKLRKIAIEYGPKFESEGLKRFFNMINEELNDEYMQQFEEILLGLRFSSGVTISAQLGLANQGTNYILRKNEIEKESWVKKVFNSEAKSYSFTVDPKDKPGTQRLKNLRDRSLNYISNAAAQSAEHIDNFFSSLRQELAFYISCLNLYDKLKEIGATVTFPEPMLSNERKHSFTGLYDLSLALVTEQKPITNELNLDQKSLVMITGANQGGKSTFLRSIGIAQLMMQCGMFVPADNFIANVNTGIFTHFKREEDTNMKSGKFDEELKRMSTIINHVSTDSLVLLNESFASTNELEGSEISDQITRALLEKRIKIFFVSHLYSLAEKIYSRNKPDNIFLRAERESDGTRTFKMIVGKPLKTSFGEDIYHEIFSPKQNE